MVESCKSTLIAGVGNRMRGDDGVGVHVVERLSSTPLPLSVEVIDCQCDLLRLSSYREGIRKIIIVDAIRAGGRAGDIHRFTYDALIHIPRRTLSAHQLSLADNLRLLRTLYPRLADAAVVLFGIEPATVDVSDELSPRVKGSIDTLLTMLIAELSPDNAETQKG